MSLWNKPISQITFEDIDEFCQKMQPEGARLDYKGIAFPNDLAKSISAFANTLGGLIILGVEASQTDNKPIWPPRAGMPRELGLSERVLSIAQEAIHPPVRVSISEVIENAHLPGHVLVVIRINESREAPHAVEGNRRIYVYERTQDRNKPYGLADVGRIAALLKRRGEFVDRRELILKENLARADRIMHKSLAPIRWISVSPICPWFDLTDRWGCSAFHSLFQAPLWNGLHWGDQTFANGSFSIGRFYSESGVPFVVAVSSVEPSGGLFCEAYASEAVSENRTLFTNDEKPEPRVMNLAKIQEMARYFIESCCRFYEDDETARPGEVIVSIGVKNALGLLMHDTVARRRSNAGFPDDEYRIDMVVPAEVLIARRVAAIAPIFEDIRFGFNAGAEAF